jgi:hypothetical protein
MKITYHNCTQATQHVRIKDITFPCFKFKLDSKIFGFISNPFNKSYRVLNLVSNKTSFANFGISCDLLCILQDSICISHEIIDI